MIRDLTNGIITLMMAKFVLNDVPHALGLTDKEPRTYTEYRMRCSRTEPWVCGHEYVVELHTEPYEWEHCPICGYGAPFMEFVKPEER